MAEKHLSLRDEILALVLRRTPSAKEHPAAIAALTNALSTFVAILPPPERQPVLAALLTAIPEHVHVMGRQMDELVEEFDRAKSSKQQRKGRPVTVEIVRVTREQMRKEPNDG